MSVVQSEMDFKPEYDSKLELMFSYYLAELKESGWIDESVYQPTPFVLSKDYTTQAYAGNKLTTVKLARGSIYTADWAIKWNKKAEGVFYWNPNGEYKKGYHPYSKPNKQNFIPFYAKDKVSYVDVKGKFSNAHGLAKFSIVQKWLLERGVYVQKIVVSLDEKGLFSRTFTPKTVITSEVYQKNSKFGNKGDSKLKYTPMLLQHLIRNGNSD